MSRLESSLTRLVHALDILDRAVETRLKRDATAGIARTHSAAHAQAAASPAGNEAARASIDALTQERDALKRKNEALEKLAFELGHEIDRAIEDVRAVLSA